MQDVNFARCIRPGRPAPRCCCAVSGTGRKVIARAAACRRARMPLRQGELRGPPGETCWSPIPAMKGSFTGAVGELELRDGRQEHPRRDRRHLAGLPGQAACAAGQEFERVGAPGPSKVDVRLVFATNRNLEKMVAAGEIPGRPVLHRINVVSCSCRPCANAARTSRR